MICPYQNQYKLRYYPCVYGMSPLSVWYPTSQCLGPKNSLYSKEAHFTLYSKEAHDRRSYWSYPVTQN